MNILSNFPKEKLNENLPVLILIEGLSTKVNILRELLPNENEVLKNRLKREKERYEESLKNNPNISNLEQYQKLIDMSFL
jgi:hypothetical protein